MQISSAGIFSLLYLLLAAGAAAEIATIESPTSQLLWFELHARWPPYFAAADSWLPTRHFRVEEFGAFPVQLAPWFSSFGASSRRPWPTP